MLVVEEEEEEDVVVVVVDVVEVVKAEWTRTSFSWTPLRRRPYAGESCRRHLLWRGCSS